MEGDLQASPCLARASDTLLLAFGRGAAATDSRGSGDRGLTRIAFTNTSCLAAKISQIVKLGATHVTPFHHVDVINDRRVQRKDSFDTDTKAGLAHGDRLARATVLARNANAFKSLQA